MKRFRKLLYSFFVVEFLFAAIYASVFFLRLIPDSLGRIYTAFAFKEGCSCLFVVKASEDCCKDYVRQFFAPDVWDRSEDSFRIEFRSFFSDFESQAIFRGSRGCRLNF
ncbi:hypothetical protein [Leptospira kmetyi]|uniref:hypothetical protein n=1 Tax=Leptospira kmetyi TaxID=408139 RepID=UPI000289B061|nr:hypothetical protein [Leptospira kmetyi]EQA52998.1 hypothetical protein LEP1GSC052_2360 [Leptospira kmetyi serovar Malaysia str. Bejo-Iso9]